MEETTSLTKLQRANELAWTSVKLQKEHLSGRGIPGPSVVMSKVQTLEGQVLSEQCRATGSVEQVNDFL